MFQVNICITKKSGNIFWRRANRRVFETKDEASAYAATRFEKWTIVPVDSSKTKPVTYNEYLIANPCLEHVYSNGSRLCDKCLQKRW